MSRYLDSIDAPMKPKEKEPAITQKHLTDRQAPHPAEHCQRPKLVGAADAQLAAEVPFAETFPVLAEQMRKNTGGRPKSDQPKVAVSLRLDQDVLARFKASGPGWQSRMNATLRKASGLPA